MDYSFDSNTARAATVESPAAAALPELGFEPVARPELCVRLDAAMTGPGGQVIAISAPAGTGKTALVLDWATRHLARSRPDTEIAWLTVGAGGTTGDEINITVAQSVSRSAESGRALVLVIDNAHLISDPAAIGDLEDFLATAPAHVTTVLSARHDLPLRWHILELPGRLTRLHATDLAFTGTRAGQLTRRHGCALSEAELTTVLRLTRGWAALLRLAAVHVTTHPDRAAALTELACPPQPLADFLADEVVAALPGALRESATALGVPESFTHALAARLTGATPDPITELTRLEFPMTATARDDEVWYTLHPLLRAHLLASLRRGGDTRLHALHHAAASWYLATDRPMAALPHLVRAPDAELLSRFLRENAVRLVLDRHGTSLFEQLRQCRSRALDDPFLGALRVLDALERDDAGKAIVCLDLLFRQPRRSGQIVPAGSIAPLTLAASAGIARATGIGLSDFRPPAPFPESGHPDIDGYAVGELGMALLARGDYDEGEQLLNRAAALSDCAAIPRLRVRAATRLALAAGIRDELGPMRRQAELAVALADRHGLADSPDGRRALAAAAFTAYLRGAGTEDARITRFLAAQRLPDPTTGLPSGRVTDVIAQLLAFDDSEDAYTGAEALRRSAVVLLRGPASLPALSGRLLPHIVRVLIDVRATNSVRLLTDQAEAVLGHSADTVLARALAVLPERPRAARGLIAPLLVDVEAARPLETVTALVVDGVAQAALGQPGAARDTLERALLAAAPDQLVRPFLDVPGAGTLLDAHIGTLGQHNEFAERIRRHPRLRRKSAQPRLTPAELTVLNQLPSGRTAAQIADVLGVSVNTVKTHLRGIYAKFGTGTRADAMELARRSGML
ncbi:LuxR C-terminal-related transcriptional regulator [Nocardia seriolae]|uniref:LuxR C-terminal-related transcriptional regulator n=2 Tax=Nocardia seriolae TaxID=37332 RepID=UPI00090B915C|nr:LuxR C-terminal-related transcriptional regulator [Nocardia seriolae]MTJ62797.1 hypothetical protein [Nocardia seriolae]MTJ73865.1 hypothetical protein [Nocardia seriolae]MTJ87830.1 hypothetical protein [Nocardia seriolae]MTK31823.1 hypothetical protein [Nocardia seriolae]MTK40731.1 hypothetical protein [Nocardia seriolae]